MRSIIPEDPERPLDESVLVWPDEVVDQKVDYMLTCIENNYAFTREMFGGGVTKADVERLRAKVKPAGKKKSISKKGKAAPLVTDDDESRITSLINAIVRTEVTRIDGDIAHVVSSLKEVSAQSAGYEKKVMAVVEGMLQAFKSEMMESSGRQNMEVPSQTAKHTAAVAADEAFTGRGNSVARDGNDDIIDDVIENLSHYSTPPADENENNVSVLCLETNYFLLALL